MNTPSMINESAIRSQAMAKAMEYLNAADALYLYNGASQSEIEDHLFRIRDLASDARIALEEGDAEIERLLSREEDEDDAIEVDQENASRSKLIAEMKVCEQMPGLSVFGHGQMVCDRYFEILAHLRDGTPLQNEWRLPDWVHDPAILARQADEATVANYALFHDCGKPRCLVIDEDGRRHFPEHAEVSKAVWLEHGGTQEEADLIGMDMDIHLLKDAGVEEFSSRPEAATLLLVGLSEIHANASLFGGSDSTSFKMKWKTIDKRGRAILRRWSDAPAVAA